MRIYLTVAQRDSRTKIGVPLLVVAQIVADFGRLGGVGVERQQAWQAIVTIGRVLEIHPRCKCVIAKEIAKVDIGIRLVQRRVGLAVVVEFDLAEGALVAQAEAQVIVFGRPDVVEISAHGGHIAGPTLDHRLVDGAFAREIHRGGADAVGVGLDARQLAENGVLECRLVGHRVVHHGRAVHLLRVRDGRHVGVDHLDVALQFIVVLSLSRCHGAQGQYCEFGFHDD